MKRLFTNNGEGNIQDMSGRASSETVRSSSAHDDLPEKMLLMDNESIKASLKPRWRQLIFPVLLHLTIFFTYSIGVFIILNTRSSSLQPNRSLLYCMTPLIARALVTCDDIDLS
jgi:hypothetical protein